MRGLLFIQWQQLVQEQPKSTVIPRIRTIIGAGKIWSGIYLGQYSVVSLTT